jgi:stage V sporulation protein G
MEITDVRVFPVNQDKLRAFVSIVLDGCFVIGDIKVISGTNGLFISMPSKRRKDGTFRDIAHPLNSDTRQLMEDRIIEAYRQEVGDDSDTRALGPDAQETDALEPDALESGNALEDAFPG